MPDAYSEHQPMVRAEGLVPLSPAGMSVEPDTSRSVAESLARISGALERSVALDSSYREVAGSRGRRISELVRERDRWEREKQQLISEKRVLLGNLTSERQERERLQAQNRRLRRRVGELVKQLAELRARARLQRQRLHGKAGLVRERKRALEEQLAHLSNRRAVRAALRVAELARPYFELKRKLGRG